jgi:ribosomal protein S15
LPKHRTVTELIVAVTSLLQSLPALTFSRAYAPCTACLFSTSATYQSIGKKKKIRKRIDPYREAQARQRKAANQARQIILQRERREAMGDPIRSKPTPFIESLGSIPRHAPSTVAPDLAQNQLDPSRREEQPPLQKPPPDMNFFLSTDELEQSLAYSKYLTTPLPTDDANRVDPAARTQELQKHAEGHENAERALAAITALDNGSSKDRTRVNVQRCIHQFGRHHTDKVLPPKPASRASATTVAAAENDLSVPQRVGPDTGSSEVQAAILTVKINALADNLGKKDKHNKRNLRVLVHKRQKLLSYLRRKERGGPRWQHLVEKLGITDAMWKGEISL